MFFNYLFYFLFSSFLKFAHFSMVPTANCNENGKRIYFRTEGDAGIDGQFGNILAHFNGISLKECAKNCTELDKCLSFQFHSDDQLKCILLADDLPKSTKKFAKLMQNSIAHFQGICIQNEEIPPSNCPSAYAFERFPGHVLFGHALQSFSAANLAECLSACLDAKRRFGMDCHSAMYFYGAALCILNREHRRSVQEGVFRFDNDLVDYFENICQNVVCGKNAELHWIQTEHFRIDPSREVVLLGKSFEECKQICIENRIHGMEFPCRAFVYSSAKKQCQLSAESGIVRAKNGRRKMGEIGRKRHKRHAMKPDFRQIVLGNSASSEQFQLDWELSAFSAGQYFEKMCIEPIGELKGELAKNGGGNEECLLGENNSGTFEFYPGKMLLGLKEMQIMPLKMLGECLWACLNAAGGQCRSVQISQKTDECILSAGTQLASPEQFRPSPFMDYFENLCPPKLAADFMNSENLGKRATRERKQRPIMAAAKEQSSIPVDGPQFTFEAEEGENSTKNAIVETDCRMSGIEIKAKFRRPSTGILFVRDHAANCSAKFNQTLAATLLLPIPSANDSEGKCPPTELGPKHWSFIVVLKEGKGEEGMNVLMGLERVFNVTCDFSSTKWENHSAPLTNLEEANGTTNLELDKMGPQPISLQMSLLRGGQPVSAVSLGEELELRWSFERELENSTKINFGMFVDSCIAERIGGDPPDPGPLALILQGCPEPSVLSAHLIGSPLKKMEDGAIETRLRVFRFDGSRRVRIRCAVDICVEECPPANCSEGNGRKRRGIEGEDVGLTTLGELAQLVQKYDRLRNAEREADDWASGEGEYENGGRMNARNGGQGNGAGLVQKSTTISGSYTINEEGEGEENGGGWQEMGEMPTQILTRNGKRPIEGEDGGKSNLVKLLKANGGQKNERRGESVEIPIAFLGGKKGGIAESKEQESRKKACQEFPTIADFSASPLSPNFCISRPLAAIGIVFLVILALLQIFQLIRLFRRQIFFPFRGKANHPVLEEEMHLPDPPRPPNSREEDFCAFGEGNVTYGHLASAIRLQEEEECCGHLHRNSVNFEEQNRRQSILSVDSPVLLRPIPQPRQTVFPTTKNMNSPKWEHISF